MLGFIFFIVAPLLLAAWIGWARAYAIIGLFIFFMMVLLLSAVAGGGLTWITDHRAFQTWEPPSLWVLEYVDSLKGTDAELYKFYSIPYIFLADLFRWYFHFGFNVGGILFWIMQFLGYWVIFVTLMVAFRTR